MKDRKILRWLWKYIEKERFPIVVLILGNAMLAGFGIGLALATRGVIDGAASGVKNRMLAYGLVLMAVILLQLVLRVLCSLLRVRLQGRLEMELKSRSLTHILTRDYSHIMKYHSGELMNRLTGDVTVVTEGTSSILPDAALLLTRLFGALTVLCLIDPVFTLVFAAAGLVLFLTSGYFRRRLKHLHRTVQEKDGLLRSLLQEILESSLVIRVFDAQKAMEEKSKERQKEHYRAKIKKNAVGILANSGFSFLFSLGYLFALLWGSLGLLTQTLSFGTLTAVLQLVGQVQTPFSGLSGLLPRISSVLASAERLIELEELPAEAEKKEQEASTAAVYTLMHGIRAEDLSFRYDRDTVLAHTGFCINKGEFAVISGPSGIGKSTLLLLLLGIYRPEGGTVGITLNTGGMLPADSDTRRLFAYVPQNTFLLSGTLRENLAFLRPGVQDADILEAARLCCIFGLISTLPKGLDTVVGEKGLGLSQGQLQRLAIARAVLYKAPILLLDEATSALDEETEKELLCNLRKLTERTCILVSHKKAALELCDKEIYIENGKITVSERSGSYGSHTA